MTTARQAQLVVFEADASKGSEIASPLEARGYRVCHYGSTTEALMALQGPDSPALLIVAADPPESTSPRIRELRARARELKIPTLDVVDLEVSPNLVLDRESDVADWVSRNNVPVELPIRVEQLLRRHGREQEDEPVSTTPSSMPIDSRFFPLIVHDLRTPLNVVGLSLRMIEQAVPLGHPELEEDLKFVEEGFRQIEGMLTQLSDYYRLFEREELSEATEFSPERLVSELVETRALKPGLKQVPVHVEVRPSCPAEARLIQTRARQALVYALSNAVAAAKTGPVYVTMHGGSDRWVTEFRVSDPSPASVTSFDLRADDFERLCGTAAERRGMDLAIVARICQLFGGTARLEVDQSHGSTLILDWPARLERHPT